MTPDPLVRRSQRGDTFVGRERALEHLLASLTLARSGRFAAVMVAGPAGMGKTRLVSEFVHGSRGGPTRVLWGACPSEGGEVTTLGPLDQVVRHLDDGHLGRGDAGVEQQVRDVVEAIRVVARAEPGTVVVLEDLHWADETTLEFLRFMAHALAHEPVLLVGTHRADADVGAPLRRLLTFLDRQPGSSRLTLGPLDREAVRVLVEHQLGASVEQRHLDEIEQRAGGVPLFVEALAEGLRSSGRPAVSARLRDVFLDRIDQLGMGARELLDWAAVCGQAFPHELLALAAEWPASTLQKRLDELLDLGVLVVDPPERGYRFRHVLVHETVRGELRPMAARDLHARCARILEARPDLTPGDARPCVDLARRWSAAEQPGPAFRAFRRAADEASDRGAHAEAARLAATAHQWFLRMPVGERDGATSVALLIRVADATDRAGDHDGAARRYAEALEVAAPGDPVRARLHVELVRSTYLAGDYARAAAAARDGVREVRARGGLSGADAVLLAVSAVFLAGDQGPEAGLARTREAVAVARASADPAVLCDVLSSHGLALARTGHAREARAALAEADRMAGGVADPRLVLRPPVFTMLLLHAVGATHDVVDLGRATMRRADELGVARGVGQEVRVILADCLVWLGRWDEASAVVEDGLAWGDEGLAGTLLLVTKVDIAIHRGRFNEAERDLATARERTPEGHFRVALAAAELAWWRRDPVASAAHAADGLARAGLIADPDELGRLAFAFVRAAGAAGGMAPGTVSPGEVAASLARRAGHPVIDAWRATIAAATATPGPEAVAAWESACAAWRALDRLPMLTWARWRTGVARAEAGDADGARTALTAALAGADRLGAVPVGVEVRAAMGTLGSPAAPPGRDVPPAVDPVGGADAVGAVAAAPEGDPVAGGNSVTVGASAADLTRREDQVLALVARGWTNKRIGDELGISPRTVGTHVSRVLRKLGVTSRGEAAAVHHQLSGDADVPA